MASALRPYQGHNWKRSLHAAFSFALWTNTRFLRKVISYSNEYSINLPDCPALIGGAFFDKLQQSIIAGILWGNLHNGAAMSKITTVLKGGSFPFTFDRGGDPVSGWICTISVQQYPGDTPAINRVVTADDLEWPGFLTATETAALPILGTWMVIAVINHASDDKTEYQTVRFHLSEAV